jgi:hypothetical protein
MTGIIRFSYLIGSWSIFEFIHHLYLIVFIALLASSDSGFGPTNATKTRTYFNVLDLHKGRGCFMIFINIIFLDRSDKGEELFCAICIVIGIINCVAGLNEKLGKLPSKPWGEDAEEEEEVDLEKSKKKPKKVDELN